MTDTRFAQMYALTIITLITLFLIGLIAQDHEPAIGSNVGSTISKVVDL